MGYDEAIVAKFAVMTVCMEGKHIFDCLEGYARRKGSGIRDNMGCYFAEELDPRDPDRVGDNVLIYYEMDPGIVKKIHLSEAQFCDAFKEAFDQVDFLFSAEEWVQIQRGLEKMRAALCPD